MAWHAEVDKFCPQPVRESKSIPAGGRCFFHSQCAPSDSAMYAMEKAQGHGFCCPVLHTCNPADKYSSKTLNGCPPISQCDPAHPQGEMMFEYMDTDCKTNPMKHYADQIQKCSKDNPDFPNNWVQGCFFAPGQQHPEGMQPPPDKGYNCPSILNSMCPQLKAGFDIADKSGDGKLSPAEISELFPAEYICIGDGDGDNKISLQEFLDMASNAMTGTLDESCVAGTDSDPDVPASGTSKSTSKKKKPSTAPLKGCKGDAKTWDGGWGGCEAYGNGKSNHNFCSGDQNQGFFANEVCPECGKCDQALPTTKSPSSSGGSKGPSGGTGYSNSGPSGGTGEYDASTKDIGELGGAGTSGSTSPPTGSKPGKPGFKPAESVAKDTNASAAAAAAAASGGAPSPPGSKPGKPGFKPAGSVAIDTNAKTAAKSGSQKFVVKVALQVTGVSDANKADTCASVASALNGKVNSCELTLAMQPFKSSPAAAPAAAKKKRRLTDTTVLKMGVECADQAATDAAKAKVADPGWLMEAVQLPLGVDIQDSTDEGSKQEDDIIIGGDSAVWGPQSKGSASTKAAPSGSVSTEAAGSHAMKGPGSSFNFDSKEEDDEADAAALAKDSAATKGPGSKGPESYKGPGISSQSQGAGSSCKGAYNFWNAGWGDCSKYEHPRNSPYCSADKNQGFSANQVCPECGQCEFQNGGEFMIWNSRNMEMHEGRGTGAAMHMVSALYKLASNGNDAPFAKILSF